MTAPSSRSFSHSASHSTHSEADGIAFIGGGNMASAIMGGLIRQGASASRMEVVEPHEGTRERLAKQFGITAMEQPGAALARCQMVVWAVKPQIFKEAALQSRFHVKGALHLSVAAGIRSDSIAHWLGSERIVRCMPNTPALVGKGMTAMVARGGPQGAVSSADRALVERVISTTGEFLWLPEEAQLDAVTALSGSGPAYVFYFLEAMIQAGVNMGMEREQAHKLAVGTFVGASSLAAHSDEPPEILRQRVTSKGGTTYAAITSMEQDRMGLLFQRAMQAAHQRAREMGDEFGAV